MNKVLNAGGKFVWDSVEKIEQVQRRYAPDLIINCAGLGSRNLIGDRHCIPVQGGWLLYNNSSIYEHPIVKEAHCTTIQENKEGGNFIFIVPRGTDKLIVGGFAVANDCSTECTTDNPLFKRIIKQNTRLLPWLKDIKPITHRVGLRPFHQKGVRLEVDNSYDVPVIHNYGHGGSGVTLSWGCALNVNKLISSSITQKSADVKRKQKPALRCQVIPPNT